MKNYNAKLLLLGLVFTALTISCKSDKQEASLEHLIKTSSLDSRLDSLLYSKKSEDKNTLKSLLDALLNSDKESNVLKAIEYYYALNADDSQYESLQRNLVKRFPKGLHARMLGQFNIITEDTLAVNSAKNYERWVEEFPPALYKNTENDVYNDVLILIAKRYANEGDFEAVKECESKLLLTPTLSSAYLDFALLFYQHKKYKQARAYLDSSIEKAKNIVSANSNKGVPNDILKYTTFEQHLLNAKLLVKENKSDKAIPFFEAYKKEKGLLNTNAIIAYAKALEKSKQPKKAFLLVEELVKANKLPITEAAYFKSLFLQTEGDASDFKAYQKQMKEEATKKLEEELAKTMINEPAPPIELVSINNQIIPFKNLQGKVLILDFWANWCIPCKASFPAAQKLVTNYKSDQNVKFLFINTFEKGEKDEITTEVKNLLAENNYDFDMYIDTKSSSRTTNVVANAFQVTGIPVKYIIDKKGNIRFKVVGYLGDLEEEVTKITAMVNMVKNSN